MSQIGRRRFLIAAGALIADPIAGYAQAPARARRVGWLGLSDGKDSSSPSVALEGLRAGLRERGWVEGDNLVIVARSGNYANATSLTEELLQAKVELIVAQGGMFFGARRVAGATPLIFHVNGDPVEAKLVASYARPGGTFTGVTNLSEELSTKRVELLSEALPHMKRLAAIANQGHPGWHVELEATQAAAKRLGLDLQWLPVYSAKDFQSAFQATAGGGANGLVAVPDNLMLSQAKSIAEFGAKQKIPAISGWGSFADAGNLMSYGPVLRDVYVKMAQYADKLLTGATAAELPVENPSRFELVINLKTASDLGIVIPRSVLLRADRMIE